ncbi:uncharacterized protein TNCT_104381 [Trichonephila clavata]|uniref:Uncharacterized protein n=1 Tax=Trichonephila clavata TaxID=2740835 RepID=A0A8X6G9P3_TRICU|nr:uncharacterized protein TNCT_104381 [Trichonephila clavata]
MMHKVKGIFLEQPAFSLFCSSSHTSIRFGNKIRLCIPSCVMILILKFAVQHSGHSKKEMANEFSENLPPKRDESVKGYASKVFKESSVSAVSAIVSTGNTPRKVFRILVFVLFTAGFLYQCIKFFTYILTYPTVVNIEIDRPDEYLAPGYTFCNYNRIKRSKFCSKYPNSCTYPNQEFCNVYPDYCGDNSSKIPMEDPIESLNMEDAIDLGHDLKNLLTREAWEDPEGPFLRLNAEEQVPVSAIPWVGEWTILVMPDIKLRMNVI